MVGNMKKLETVTSMSVTKCAGDDYSMLVAVPVISIANIDYFFTYASGTTFKRCFQHRISVTNNHTSSTTLSRQPHCHRWKHLHILES